VFTDLFHSWPTPAKTALEKAFPGLEKEKTTEAYKNAVTELHSWLKAHVSLMMANVDEGVEPQHEWLTQSGVPVLTYIDPREYGETGTNGLNPTVRVHIVEHAKYQIEHDQSSGTFLDDVNFACANRQFDVGLTYHQRQCTTMEQEQNAAGSNFRVENEEMAKLVDQLRSALKGLEATPSLKETRAKEGVPTTYTLDISSHASDWGSLGLGNEQVKAAISHSNVLTQQGGADEVRSQGIYEVFLLVAGYIAKEYGTHVALIPNGDLTTEEPRRIHEEEFELATYYTVSDGGDYDGYGTSYGPKEFWKGWCSEGKDDKPGECTTAVGNLNLGSQWGNKLFGPGIEAVGSEAYWGDCPPFPVETGAGPVGVKVLGDRQWWQGRAFRVAEKAPSKYSFVNPPGGNPPAPGPTACIKWGTGELESAESGRPVHEVELPEKRGAVFH
jgi:hypothetical protein